MILNKGFGCKSPLSVQCQQTLVNWVAEVFEYFFHDLSSSTFIFQAFIPKALVEVKNAEEDAFRLASGKGTSDMYYTSNTGIKQVLSLSQPAPPKTEMQHKENSSLDSNANSNSGESIIESRTDGDEQDTSDTESGSLTESETEIPVDKKAARKENKKKVKEEKRKARKSKVPKAVKKRKKKLAKAHKTR